MVHTLRKALMARSFRPHALSPTWLCAASAWQSAPGSSGFPAPPSWTTTGFPPSTPGPCSVPSLGTHNEILVGPHDFGGEGSIIAYHPGFLGDRPASALFAHLRDRVPWRQETDAVGPQGRLSAYYGDAGCTFSYVGLTLEPRPWLPALVAVRALVDGRLCAAGYPAVTACLANHYPQGGGMRGSAPTTLHYTTLHDVTQLVHYTTHYTTLHYTTLHYTTLHYTTLHYATLRYATLHYTTLHYTTLHYTTLHYTTLHYTTLHYTTLHYTTLHYTTLHYTTLHYTTLHYTTLHYTTLHYTTLHYTTLHHTTLH